MKAPVNPAVQANLDKVLAAEQQTAALRMAQIRLALSALAAVVILVLDPRGDAIAPTRWGVLVMLVVSAVVYALTRWVKAVGRWGALAVALVDVPAIAVIQAFQAQRLPLEWYGLPTAVALPMALVVLSMLSLSRRIIFVTAAMATLTIVRRLSSTGLPMPPMVLTAMMPAAAAVVGSVVVERLRSLVRAARQKDLVGKYILGERLGSGGMAEVFLATYSPEGGFERKVAVKRILPGWADKPESVALFRREAELGAMLAHPNIVQVLDFGSDQDSWFIAMEYVDGLPLSRVLALLRKDGHPIPLPAAVWVLEQLAEALDYIHTRTTADGAPLGLIHRDVNPPNVLLSRLGEVKLNDFGIARANTSESLTGVGLMRGKVSSASPEQLLGGAYDTRADLWALGTVAFELLTGHRPFRAPDELALIKAVLEGPIPRVKELRPDVPEALDALVNALLTRPVAERLQNANLLRHGLDTLDPLLTDRAVGRRQVADLVQRALSANPEQHVFSGTPASQKSKDADVTRTSTRPEPTRADDPTKPR